MSRRAPQSLEAVVRGSIAESIAQVAPRLARLFAAAAGRAGGEPARRTRSAGARAGRKARRPRTEITRWTADARARRVPTFVIEATGLETKKSIVAKYGPATFEKGQPLPATAGEKKDGKPSPKRRTERRKDRAQRTAPATEQKAAPVEPRAVVARPPIVRKRSATA